MGRRCSRGVQPAAVQFLSTRLLLSGGDHAPGRALARPVAEDHRRRVVGVGRRVHVSALQAARPPARHFCRFSLHLLAVHSAGRLRAFGLSRAGRRGACARAALGHPARDRSATSRLSRRAGRAHSPCAGLPPADVSHLQPAFRNSACRRPTQSRSASAGSRRSAGVWHRRGPVRVLRNPRAR